MRIYCERIKDLRKDNGLTLVELSEKTNIPITTLSRLESGRTDIKGDQLIALSNFYKISTDYILGLED